MYKLLCVIGRNKRSLIPASSGDLPTIPCATPPSDNSADAAVTGDKPKDVVQGQTWAEDFQVRSCTEKSHNCIGVDKDVIERIVGWVFEELLADPAAEVRTFADGRSWNAGGEWIFTEFFLTMSVRLIKLIN